MKTKYYYTVTEFDKDHVMKKFVSLFFKTRHVWLTNLKKLVNSKSIDNYTTVVKYKKNGNFLDVVDAFDVKTAKRIYKLKEL